MSQTAHPSHPQHALDMPEYAITIPRPHSVVLGFVKDDLPGVAAINAAAHAIEDRIVFRWHLSVLVEAELPSAHALPDAVEQGAILDVQAQLASLLEADGQAVWLARHYHDGAWELLWRVHDVRGAQTQLNALIDAGTHLRPFSYKLQDDPNWQLAEDELQQTTSTPSN